MIEDYITRNNTYEEWRNSLPYNLKNTDERLYNLKGAYEGGMQPKFDETDNLYHLGTRNPYTGEILKRPLHSTYLRGLLDEMNLGYMPITQNGVTRTVPIFDMQSFDNNYNGPIKPNKYDLGSDIITALKPVGRWAAKNILK